jgi:hypothetical protein
MMLVLGIVLGLLICVGAIAYLVAACILLDFFEPRDRMLNWYYIGALFIFAPIVYCCAQLMRLIVFIVSQIKNFVVFFMEKIGRPSGFAKKAKEPVGVQDTTPQPDVPEKL